MKVAGGACDERVGALRPSRHPCPPGGSVRGGRGTHTRKQPAVAFWSPGGRGRNHGGNFNQLPKQTARGGNEVPAPAAGSSAAACPAPRAPNIRAPGRQSDTGEGGLGAKTPRQQRWKITIVQSLQFDTGVGHGGSLLLEPRPLRRPFGPGVCRSRKRFLRGFFLPEEKNRAGICKEKSLKGRAKNYINFPGRVSSRCRYTEARPETTRKPVAHAQATPGAGSLLREKLSDSHNQLPASVSPAKPITADKLA